jgi:hypothetical protein
LKACAAGPDSIADHSGGHPLTSMSSKHGHLTAFAEAEFFQYRHERHQPAHPL